MLNRQRPCTADKYTNTATYSPGNVCPKLRNLLALFTGDDLVSMFLFPLLTLNSVPVP